jgi:serine phosphatase RsbU (regulator of sigma subunit)
VADAQEMLSGLLRAARLDVPGEVTALLTDQGRALGAESVSVYLVDHEQYYLVPLPQSDCERGPLRIDGTVAGRCFRQLELQQTESEGTVTMWVPVLDGLERLGVVELTFAAGADRASDQEMHAFGAIIAELVLVKSAYGDLFQQVRRRQPMSVAAEIAWHLMPPLTFGTERLVISAVLAPVYDIGGDCFDYAIDTTTARFAVFDAMGHGLGAGLLATVAVGSYRNARRRGLDLLATVREVDAAVGAQFGGEQFVTGLLAELDLASGRLRWHSAGHPAPLLLRSGRVVKTLVSEPALPLGLEDRDRAIAEEPLEPADRLLLYTDGVTEARSSDGDFFGTGRLSDLVAREEAACRPAPETMRRLMHAILAHQEGQLQDDATAMLVEWNGDGADRITPES